MAPLAVDPRKAHHLIPQANDFLIHPVIQKAAGQGFHIDEALNGIPVSDVIHNAPHIQYSAKIKQLLNNWNIQYPNATGLEAYS
ncbi:AHH domain-containing protein [Nonlabens ulvanivorans]|uniref:Uncharacterized protein n=1 Tax=Nonlabens ulvanivorans TaxID=906888 RepID=A0A090WA26_NONUL|nr:AHH domain-containing protein [Nonlabens ulvanivorans]WOI22271.1 AHH domain-containing protein [Nonlabens ulvanivorans]GAL73811.1 hypothetical protein JCM19275_2658 [Nonlabens ulvanivorans]